MHTLNHIENATVPHTHTHAASLEAKLPKKINKYQKKKKETQDRQRNQQKLHQATKKKRIK